MTTHILTENEIMEKVSNWKFRKNGIELAIAFTDFNKAFSFMTSIALMAEKADHHPEWSNVYNIVTIKLNSHDAKGITQLDFDLAQTIDSLSERCKNSYSLRNKVRLWGTRCRAARRYGQRESPLRFAPFRHRGMGARTFRCLPSPAQRHSP